MSNTDTINFDNIPKNKFINDEDGNFCVQTTARTIQSVAIAAACTALAYRVIRGKKTSAIQEEAQ